ncbi:MAG: ribosome-associated translation inhibitor RaiA [Candidatus Pacebacteria bacterium]|nr:ribosome-associated translation inhibitor RaiA [Candidatus Paceibacterota bacterium]
MNISIKTTNIELTPALKDYTEKRISGINKFTGEEVTAAVEIGKTSNHHKNGEDLFRAEVNVTTSLGKQLRAVSEKSDLYEAIDDVREQMVRELKSAKGKEDALWKKGARKIKSMMRGFRS